MDDNRVQFAVKAIQDYLTTHPESADTIEGVHQWWIQWPAIPESIATTATALTQLEHAALIERRRIGNREIWRLPRGRTLN
jgi:hypothetical protein